MQKGLEQWAILRAEQEQAGHFYEKVMSLQRRWSGDVVRRLEEESNGWNHSAYQFSDSTHSTFALTLWRAILIDCDYESFYTPDGLSNRQLYEIEKQGDYYYLDYFDNRIAHGTEQWVQRAKVLHSLLYQEQKRRLPEEIHRSGLFEQPKNLKNLLPQKDII